MSDEEEIRSMAMLPQEALVFQGKELPVWSGGHEGLYEASRIASSGATPLIVVNFMLWVLTRPIIQSSREIRGKQSQQVEEMILEWSETIPQSDFIVVQQRLIELRLAINALQVKVRHPGRASKVEDPEKKTEPIPAG